jgi:hypothetical protein
MPADQFSEWKRNNEKKELVLLKGGARLPLRKRSLRHNRMKKILLLISIGLLAVFCAGCMTEDAGTAAAENQSAVLPQGRERPANVTDGQVPPIAFGNGTSGSMEPGSMQPGMPGNSTDVRPMPPDGMNGTPGSMGPGSLPSGEASFDRPDMNQTGIPGPGITGV